MNKFKFLKNKIEKKLAVITNKKKCNFFGRANTAIWCIGEFLKINSNKKTIILPSTMCVSPAIIFKILGFRLIFVDVNKNDGLLNINKTLQLIKKNKDIACIFYVNLFGNKDSKTSKLKKVKNIYVIQDLAQTYFHKKNIKKDIFGDLIILSFGYSKIFDFGHGGIILSDNKKFYDYGIKFNNNLKNIKISNLYKNKYLKWYDNTMIKKKSFSKNILKSFASKLYLIKFNNKKLAEIYKSINLITNDFKRRFKLLKIYKKKFKNFNIQPVHSAKIFSPWRFSFLVNDRDYYLGLIRKKGFDASAYYPNIGAVFNRRQKFVNSDVIEKKIINLWLTKNYNLNKINNISSLFKNEK